MTATPKAAALQSQEVSNSQQLDEKFIDIDEAARPFTTLFGKHILKNDHLTISFSANVNVDAFDKVLKNFKFNRKVGVHEAPTSLYFPEKEKFTIWPASFAIELSERREEFLTFYSALNLVNATELFTKQFVTHTRIKNDNLLFNFMPNVNIKAFILALETFEFHRKVKDSAAPTLWDLPVKRQLAISPAGFVIELSERIDEFSKHYQNCQQSAALAASPNLDQPSYGGLGVHGVFAPQRPGNLANLNTTLTLEQIQQAIQLAKQQMAEQCENVKRFRGGKQCNVNGKNDARDERKI